MFCHCLYFLLLFDPKFNKQLNCLISLSIIRFQGILYEIEKIYAGGRMTHIIFGLVFFAMFSWHKISTHVLNRSLWKSCGNNQLEEMRYY